MTSQLKGEPTKEMKEDIVLANESLNKWCNTEGINYYEGDTALGLLFKYAVPKLHDEYKLLYINFDAPFHEQEIEDMWLCQISSDYTGKTWKVLKEGSTPALALFWAIYEVVKSPP